MARKLKSMAWFELMHRICYTKLSNWEVKFSGSWALPELKNEMKNTKRFNPSNTFLVVVLIATLFGASCRSRATHLTQNLENSRVPGQQSTQTPEAVAQTPGQETSQLQSPTSGIASTATVISTLATRGASATLPPIQTPTSTSVVVSPTATKKSTTAQAATSTLVPTQTRTSTLTPIQTTQSTSTPTLTPTPTKTATAIATEQTGWQGEWTAYIGQDDGSFFVGSLTVSLTEDNFLGEVLIDNEVLVFNGDFSGYLDRAYGTWSTQTRSGHFHWLFVSDDQFRGNIGGGKAFCAARNGALQPNPCFYAPED